MDSHGVLVGWAHQDLGDKLLLRIESFGAAPSEQSEPDNLRLLLTKQQAVILGNHLIELAGQTPPGDRSLFRRLFG